MRTRLVRNATVRLEEGDFPSVRHPVKGTNRVVGTTSGPEAVRAFQKVLFLDGLQHLADGIVDHSRMLASFSTILHNSGDVCSGEVAIGPFTVTLLSAEFVITDDTCSTGVIPTGSTCTVGVALRPTSAGGKSATLLVTPPSSNPAVEMLTGTGIPRIDAGLVEPMDSGPEQGAGNISIDGSSG